MNCQENVLWTSNNAFLIIVLFGSNNVNGKVFEMPGNLNQGVDIGNGVELLVKIGCNLKCNTQSKSTL